jgi:hypothetical protein
MGAYFAGLHIESAVVSTRYGQWRRQRQRREDRAAEAEGRAAEKLLRFRPTTCAMRSPSPRSSTTTDASTGSRGIWGMKACRLADIAATGGNEGGLIQHTIPKGRHKVGTTAEKPFYIRTVFWAD